MAKFFRAFWRVITFPFVAMYRLIVFPFRTLSSFLKFLNTEPEDHSLTDTLAGLAADSQVRESLWNHVEELRAHLLRMLVGLAIAVGVSFYFTVPLMEFLAEPVGGLTRLQAIEVTEEIGVFMRVALTSGITISLPYIAFELWRFAATGLRSREKKFSLVAIPAASVLFVVGLGLTQYLLIPAALPFLGGFTEIAQFWTAKEYFGFITGLMLWIGLFCEFPLVVFLLSYFEVITPRLLAQQWRLAVVVIAILAAAVTPTIDPVNMGLVMLPMILLYFASIGMSYLARALRRRNKSAADMPVDENKAPA